MEEKRPGRESDQSSLCSPEVCFPKRLRGEMLSNEAKGPYILHLYIHNHAVPIAVSCRLATAEARVRARVRSCIICGGQSGTGAGSLRVLRLPLPIIPPMAPHS